MYERSVVELSEALSPDLQQELRMLTLPFDDDSVPSEGELRVAQAQLVGWLEGLFHGIQATLFAQQLAARQQLCLLYTSLFIIIADQLTKHWAVNELVDRDIDVFWTLRFNLSYNTGMAFSRGESLGPIIGVVALVVVVVLLLSIKRQPGRLTDVAVGMIVGGAIGNVIDRLFRQDAWLRGGVVDFIDFQWFPIFNIADIGVTVGGALLVLASWMVGRQQDRPVDDEVEVA